MCVVFDCASVGLLKKPSIGIIEMKLDKGNKVVFVAAIDDSGILSMINTNTT